MKKWTDDDLMMTHEKLKTWNKQVGSAGSKLWLFTAFLGAFAISTGFAFMFFDGVDIMSIALIIMGTVTCASWYMSDKRRKDNIAYLAEINKEIKSRKLKPSTQSEGKNDGKTPQTSHDPEESQITKE